MVITLDVALQMIDAMIEHAERMGNLCSCAVYNKYGELITAQRMDGALIPTIDIARDKAWTAAVFKMPSSGIAKFGNPSTPGFGFNTQNWNDRLTTIAGGLPVTDENDEVVGAVGVSGGTPEQDVAVCQAGIAAFSSLGSKV